MAEILLEAEVEVLGAMQVMVVTGVLHLLLVRVVAVVAVMKTKVFI
jgi:hypothetical protein